jgi:hypothetical protein
MTKINKERRKKGTKEEYKIGRTITNTNPKRKESGKRRENRKKTD